MFTMNDNNTINFAMNEIHKKVLKNCDQTGSQWARKFKKVQAKKTREIK